MSRANAILLRALLFSAPIAASGAVAEKAQAQVYVSPPSVYIGAPPAVYIATSPPEYFEGRPVYWYQHRWHYRDQRGWNYYREEPRYLRERRGHWEHRPRYHYHR